MWQILNLHFMIELRDKVRDTGIRLICKIVSMNGWKGEIQNGINSYKQWQLAW